MARVARRRHRRRRPPAGPLPDAASCSSGPASARSACPALRSTDYINTIPPEREPWFPGDEHIERRIRAYIRWNAAIMVSPGQPARARRRRPHRHLRLGRVACTRWASTTSSAARTDGESGDQVFFQGHASPGIYARAFLEGRLTEAQLDGFRQEKSHARRRPAVLPAPAADAGLLGVPDRLDGPRPDRARSTRPGSTATCTPAGIEDTVALARLGVPRRRRDGRARVARRDRRRRPRGAGQPHLRHQLQPAAPRRPGPRQRQDHPGAGVVLPRRRLERHQGHLGPRLGPAAGPGRRRRAGQQDEHHAGRPVPDLLGRVRRLHPRELLRRRPAAAQDGRAPVRRRAAQALPRRPRLPQGLRGVQGGAASTSASRP